MLWKEALTAVALFACAASAGFVNITCLDWSPDGKSLLFAQDGVLYLGQAPNGGHPVQLTPDTTWISWARFSPDGEWIVYVTPVEGGYALWRDWIADREPEQLLFSESPIYQPTVAPSGTEIAFISATDSQRDLFLYDLESGETVRLTHTPFQEACPDFSPDGTALLFVGLWSTGKGGESWDIFVLDIESGDVEQLTDDAFFDWCPRFSPDGEWIAFESNRSGHSDVYVMRRDGTDLTPFTYDEWRDAFPVWAPKTGEMIAFASKRVDGWVILAEGTF